MNSKKIDKALREHFCPHNDGYSICECFVDGIHKAEEITTNKNEQYKNGYHDGYAEALVALRAILNSLPNTSHDYKKVDELLGGVIR